MNNAHANRAASPQAAVSSPEPAVTSGLPKSEAASAVRIRGHATRRDDTQVALRTRVPWRPVGTGIASIGVPLGMAVLRPLLGEVMAITEVAVIITVLATALFGSSVLSERAFRLLRWLADRPEPPGPSPPGTAELTDSVDAADHDLVVKQLERRWAWNVQRTTLAFLQVTVSKYGQTRTSVM